METTTDNPKAGANSRDLARLKKQLKHAEEEAARYKAKFEVEMNAKNKAYFFILACGHLADFAAFNDAITLADFDEFKARLLAEYEQEAKATAKADEAAELRRRAELADLKRKAGKLGAVITFTEADAAATDEPEDATAPKEGAESHETETMTDNTPKR